MCALKEKTDKKVELTAKRISDFDVHLFAGKSASAVAIEMRQEPCLEMRHLVTTVASALLSALSHRTPSWIKRLAGEKRRSPCTAPRLHMVRSCDEKIRVQSHPAGLNHFKKTITRIGTHLPAHSA